MNKKNRDREAQESGVKGRLDERTDILSETKDRIRAMRYPRGQIRSPSTAAPPLEWSRRTNPMSLVEKPPAIPAEDMAALEKAVANLIKGVRDPKLMDEAAREMDEGREEIRRRFGEVDLAVELTRESRDET